MDPDKGRGKGRGRGMGVGKGKAAVLLFALLVLGLVAPASALASSIRPGDIMSSSTGQCTLNFLFDGVGALEGRVYFGTAAHCVGSIGQSIDSSPHEDFATVAIIGSASWARSDWAFLEVKPAFHHLVRAGVKGHPDMPTGIATMADTMPGDAIQLSGYGMLFGTTTPTQEQRVGALTVHEPDRVQIVAPVIFGDSGGPIVHIPTGKALSLNSRLCGPGACTEIGPAYDDIMRQAAARGFTVELRTV